jgi:hypothetical protein
MPSDTRFRFFVLTCRAPESDFRRPLVEALRHRYETYYIWLRRRPVVSGPLTNNEPAEMSLPAFLRFVWRFRPDGSVNVWFNSTNTYFPGLSTLLRVIGGAGVWCLDMHDDLRYHNTGLARRREELIIILLRRLSHVTVHAAPTLRELFPDSHHIGNASNILQVPRKGASDDNVLIIASFDERFDFDFLSDVAQACPSMEFHLYGWTQRGDTATKAQITAADARHKNIRYRGPYKVADLPAILGAYRVSLAPYRTGMGLTRYIDPLRFYHCLNAGLEVVSTDIPQARHMRDWVHVVSDVTSCVETLRAIRSGTLAKQPAYSPVTWEQRVDRLVEIVSSVPRTAALLGKRANQRTGGAT